MFLTFIALLSAAVRPDFARNSMRDFEDFYRSFQGAIAVLPKLKGEIPPEDFAAVAHAMDNLAADFLALERRLSRLIPGADHSALAQAHALGRLQWENPANQTRVYWSGNGPMSVYCFGLTKRLGEDFPPGF